MNIPEEANVVIIGGGVIGCSIAYHLGKLGWKDILLLERKKLTCGTTWHAAGLIAQLRATQNMTRLAKYSQELYWDLEKETGVVTGFKRNGSMTVALTEERLEELNRQADMARDRRQVRRRGDLHLLRHKVSRCGHWLHKNHHAIRPERTVNVRGRRSRDRHIVKAVEEADKVERRIGRKVVARANGEAHILELLARRRVDRRVD